MTQRAFTIRILFFSVGNGAMKAPRYWQLRDDAQSAVETSANRQQLYEMALKL
jgi:hypothetical protein